MDAWLLWFLIGVGLFLMEFAAPGVVLVFFALGAWIVAVTSGLGLTNDLTPQLILFTVSSIVLLFTLRKLVKSWFVGDDKVMGPEDEFIGHQVKVTELIPGGSKKGKVEHKGAGWTAISEEKCEVGDVVEITEVNGLTFTVKPV